MRKKLLSLLLALLCAVSTSVTALGADRCAGFLGEHYDVLSYDFEGSAPSFGTVCTGIADTAVLKVGNGANILNGTGAFAGKTYLSFAAMADGFESFVLSVNSAPIVGLSADGDDALCTVGGKKLCTVLGGEWAEFEVFLDTFSKKAAVTVTLPTGTVAEGDVTLADAEPVSSVSFGAHGSVYIDDLKMSRSIKSFDRDIIITGDGNCIGAFCENPKDDKLYLAQFRENTLINCSVSANGFKSLYAEVYINADVKEGDVFKAFLWNSDLAPQKINSILSSEDVEASEITVSGSISANTVKTGDNAVFNVSFSDGYNGSYKVVVYGEDGLSTTLNGKAGSDVSFVPSAAGEYSAFLYAQRGKRSALAGKCTFSAVTPLSDNSVLMFPADKDYYVLSSKRVVYDNTDYIPLMIGGHVYMTADRIKKITGIEINGGKISYLGNLLAEFDEQSGAGADGKFSVSIKHGLYSLGDVCTLLGFKSEMQSDVLCISKGESIDIFDCRDVLFDTLAEKTSTGCFDWSKGTHTGGTYDAATGIFSVGAVQSSMAAFGFKNIAGALNGSLYEVSFDVKYSDDSENIMPWVGMFGTKNGTFSSLPSGVGTTKGEKCKWTKAYSYFSRRTMDSDDFDAVTFFYVGVKREKDAAASGSLLFRNVRVREVSILPDSTECEIVCEKFASWHTLDEAVTYKPKDGSFSGFESVVGTVYNSDGDAVFEKAVSAGKFAKDGWSYTPDRLGYYEIEFTGIRDDGSESLLVNAYTENYSGSYVAYVLPRRSFAVLKGAAKPMKQRSDLLMLSDSALYENNVKIADMIGFSGIRIHGVAWGDTAGEKGFHKAKGKFDWTTADRQINNVKKYGFKNVIANIFATPAWAVSRTDYTTDVGYNGVGLYDKNCYPPDDLDVAREGCGEYAKRYKDVIDAIEVWNEPTYGNTAFWYQGSRSNAETEKEFADLTVAASEAIRENAPGVKVYTAGFNQADSFFKALLKQDGYVDAFDGVTCHGRYSDPEVYREILDTNNLSDKELLNSEGYYYAYYDVGVPKDYKKNNMVFYLQYLKHIKMGVSKITHFSLFDNNPDERRVYTKGWNCAGLFRDYPYIEPHQGAVAAYNLFDGLGADVSFGGEYAFSNGVRAVSINTDGGVNVYFWNSADSGFYLPSELADCVGSQSILADFEGNTADKDARFASVRMYCIENADALSVGKLTNTANSALSSEFIAPYYTSDTGKDDGSYTPIEGYYTKGALFDRSTFTDTEMEPVYNSDGGVWIANGENAQDISAKFAVSFDGYGMYVKAVVNDDQYVNHSNQLATMANHDSIRFAVDCGGRWQNSERSEFIAGCQGIVNNVLYKYYAADKNEAVVENWHPSETSLGSNYLRIVRSDADKTTTYRVFVPYSELYPLNESKVDGEVKFALSVTDRDGGTMKGYLSFGMGLADTQVWKYMNLKLK